MTIDFNATLRTLRRARARLTVLVAIIAVALGIGGAPRHVSGASAAPASEAWRALAQAPVPVDSTDTAEPEEPEVDEEEVPIPPNLLMDDPPASPDTLRAPGAPADSAALERDSVRVVPNVPAEPETLFSVPPGMKPTATGDKPAAAEPIVERKVPRGGILGLTPAVVILSLAVLHFLVVRSIN